MERELFGNPFISAFDSIVSIPIGDIILDWPLTNSIIPDIGTDKNATFTRASKAIWEDSSGILQLAAVDEARFESAGFLQEPQRTNKCENYNVIGADQLGSELFTGSITLGDGWTDEGGGVYSCDGTQTISSDLWANAILDKGKIFEVTFTIDSISAGGIKGKVSGQVGPPSETETGTYTHTILNKSGFSHTGLQADADFTGTVSNTTVKEIGGTDLGDDSFISGLGTGVEAYYDVSWFNPIPGMILSGDTAAVLSIVTDATELASAGLDTLITSDKVYKLDNSGGAAVSNIDIGGALSAADHPLSAYARGASASDDDIKLRTDNVDGTAQDLTNAYVRYDEVITALAADVTQIEIPAGDTVYFVLNQSEIGAAITSPIITDSTVGGVTREADDLQLPVADKTNYRASEGMLFYDVTTGFAAVDISGDIGFIGTRANATSLSSYDGTNISSDDGINTADDVLTAVFGSLFKIYGRWSSGINLQVGSNGGSGSAVAYDNAFDLTGGKYRIGFGSTEAFHIK
ncbi:hypothetical protein KAR91_35325, partial [Candidatus Pacearchaeota archaeon]|nr:hypothetical protein [Candidatus Pacearchaeota archaeon]